MTGYVFCLTEDEMKDLTNNSGYPYALKEKSRWLGFNFEESSIDLTIMPAARIVVENLVYDVLRQYFIRESDTKTSRLLIVGPCHKDCELVTFDEETKEGN